MSFKWHDDTRSEDEQQLYDELRGKYITMAIDKELVDLVRHIIHDQHAGHPCLYSHLVKSFELDNPELVEIVWMHANSSIIDGRTKELMNIIENNTKRNKCRILTQMTVDKYFADIIWNILWNGTDNDINQDIPRLSNISKVDLGLVYECDSDEDNNEDWI